MSTLSGKIAVVTGSSKGIGVAIAQKLAKEGAKVIVNYNGNRAAANAVVEAILVNDGEAFAVQADVSQKGGVICLFDQSIAQHGQVDI